MKLPQKLQPIQVVIGLITLVAIALITISLLNRPSAEVEATEQPATEETQPAPQAAIGFGNNVIHLSAYKATKIADVVPSAPANVQAHLDAKPEQPSGTAVLQDGNDCQVYVSENADLPAKFKAWIDTGVCKVRHYATTGDEDFGKQGAKK